MRRRTIGLLLAVWATATALLCACVHQAFALGEEPRSSNDGAVLASVWANGVRVARARVPRVGDRDASLDAALASTSGAVLRYETVAAEGPVPAFSESLFALSLAPARDGLVATMGGRTEYLTPDDLLAHQAYRHAVRLPVVDLSLGVDVPLALALLADRFGVSVGDVRQRARLRRARFARPTAAQPVDVTADALLNAALAAARFVARGVDAQGRFRFLVDGATNQTLPGYDWPRHAGATYFLAQAAERFRDPHVGAATLRAAGLLRGRMVACGAARCIADGTMADVGSAALATLAFVEVVRASLDPSYRVDAAELAAFLREQQRPDGEFMHLYDRQASRPVDVQLLYYSGEAALALSRTHQLLSDPRDLDAAKRAVARLAGPAWSFFGSRYYFGEEHWTCEAMADLWGRSPNPVALDFCLRWLAFWRTAQQGPADTPYDADGAYGVGPIQVPPLTPIASRCEAGLATLAVAERTAVARAVTDALDTQMKRSLALLMRQQVRATSPARLGLLSDPEAVDGAFPASEVDWSLRVDFAQHAGSALLGGLARGVPK
jgi:hypothetical protein